MKKHNFKEEGNKFHKRVERILSDSGFKIIYSDLNKKGPDIIAELENKKIIVQCRNSPEGNRFKKLEDEIDSYSSKLEKHNADRAVLAFSGYELPKSFHSKLERWLKSDGVAIWTDSIINNYASLVKSIGTYSK